MGNDVAVQETPYMPPALEMPSNVRMHLENIRQFHEALLEHLKEGHDYMVIPGTQTKSLLQPGAEKVMRFFQARPRHTIVHKIEDWDKPFFHYHYKVEIVHVGTGAVIGEGEGMCNSDEDKYKYRWVYPSEVPAEYKDSDGKVKPTCPFPKKWRGKKGAGGTYVYRMPNMEAASLANTIMQMSMKRAEVKAARTLGCLSGLFTQDLEDLKNVIDIEIDEETKEGAREAYSTMEKGAKEEAKASSKKPSPTSSSAKKQTESSTSSTATSPGDDFVKVTMAQSKEFVQFVVDMESGREDQQFSDARSAVEWLLGSLAKKDIYVDTVSKALSSIKTRAVLNDMLKERYNVSPFEQDA